jgi:hypothetical protein
MELVKEFLAVHLGPEQDGPICNGCGQNFPVNPLLGVIRFVDRNKVLPMSRSFRIISIYQDDNTWDALNVLTYYDDLDLQALDLFRQLSDIVFGY